MLQKGPTNTKLSLYVKLLPNYYKLPNIIKKKSLKGITTLFYITVDISI